MKTNVEGQLDQPVVFEGTLEQPVVLEATLMAPSERLKGYTPIKGVDYYTEEEKQDLIEEVSEGVTTGKQGKSAYEVAVENGFVGTEEEWLASLEGDQGETGDSGVYIGTTPPTDPDIDVWINPDGIADPTQGPPGPKGDPGEQGPQGEKGETGDSGVYLGAEEPTDPDVNVWIDPDGTAPSVGGASTAAEVSFDDTTAQLGTTEAPVADVQKAIEALAGNSVDLSQYYTKTEIDSAMPIPNYSSWIAPTFNDTKYRDEDCSFSNVDMATPAWLKKTFTKYGMVKNSSNSNITLTFQDIFGKEYMYAGTSLALPAWKFSSFMLTNDVVLPKGQCAILIGPCSIAIVSNLLVLARMIGKNLIYIPGENSGLTATTLSGAIDELAAKINSLVDANEVSY